MFPLSRAQLRMHTGRETSAHKKTWRVHTGKCSLQKCFCLYFIHLIPNSKEILCAHRLKKFSGNIGLRSDCQKRARAENLKDYQNKRTRVRNENQTLLACSIRDNACLLMNLNDYTI